MNFLKGKIKPAEILSTFADIVCLNLLWLVCCIPIITIGASTTAMYRVTLKMVRGEGSLVKTFFQAFRENFKQATVIWLILLAVGFIIVLDFKIVSIYSFPYERAAGIVFGCIIILIFILLQYLFPLIAQFKNTSKNILRNAAIMSIKHFPKTILMILLSTAPIVAWLFIDHWFFYFGSHCIFGGVALIAYLKSRMLVKIFDAYHASEALNNKDIKNQTRFYKTN